MGKQKIQTKRKEFRLSDADMELLKGKAEDSGMDASSYLRAVIQNRPIDNPEIKSMLKQLVYEINRIGNNMNQLVHNINAGFLVQSDITEIKGYQKKLEQDMAELLKYCRTSK